VAEIRNSNLQYYFKLNFSEDNVTPAMTAADENHELRSTTPLLNNMTSLISQDNEQQSTREITSAGERSGQMVNEVVK
jgi:hypothetical protein